MFNVEYGVIGRIPGVHQDGAKQQSLLVDAVGQHVMHMVQFSLAIAVRIVDAEIYDPKLIEVGIDMHTCHHPTLS